MDTKSVFQSALDRGQFSGLQRRLLLFVVLPLALVSAMGIRFGLDQAGAIQEERMKKDIELIARAIGFSVGQALAENDREAIQLALQSVFTIGRVYGASVFDVNGQPLASAGVTEVDLASSAIPGQIIATGEQQGDYREVLGRDVFSHFMPVFGTAGQIEGLIQITRRASDFDDALDRLTVIAWLVWGGLSLAIVVTVLLGHYGSVGRHVDKLLAFIKGIEQGDREQRAAVAGPAEVRAIATGLNRMIDSISVAEQHLRDHRDAERVLMSRLKESEKMAAIGRMAGGVAHELGAPLSVIDARARRLSQMAGLPQEGRRQGEGIRQQVTRLTRIVRQLLDYSRPESSRRQAVEAEPLLTAVAKGLGPEAQAGGVALEVIVAPGLQQFPCDPLRLELALLNIVRNALQAARQKVIVSADQQGAWLVISVDDDGPGLPPGPSRHFLEPFVTTKPAGEGSGLGLAIAHTVINEHRGRLALGNRVEGGCRVTIELPVDDCEVNEGEA